MIANYESFIAHLKRTGRIKLLPEVLRELQTEAARQSKLISKKETVMQNPSLVSGWRSIEDGKLTDRSGKGALIAIYRNITR